MKFIAAYLLACLGAAAAEEEGHPARPTVDDVRRILASVGAEADEEDRLDLLFARLEGKDVAELLAAGREQLAYAPSGAGAAVAAAAPAAEAEEKKEEEEAKKEEEEEEEDSGLFNLFD